MLAKPVLAESAAAVIVQRGGGDDGEHHDDESGRGPDGNLHHVGEQQLDRDRREDHRQARLQVAQPGRRPGQQEVQRPHTEQGEQVGRVDDERIGRDGENRRDRIDGEDHVGCLGHDQDHEQRRREQAASLATSVEAVVANDEALAMQPVRHRQEPPQDPQHPRVLRCGVILAAQHVVGGHEQNHAENVDDRVDGLEQGDAGGDEGASHEQSAQDAEH